MFKLLPKLSLKQEGRKSKYTTVALRDETKELVRDVQRTLSLLWEKRVTADEAIGVACKAFIKLVKERG